MKEQILTLAMVMKALLAFARWQQYNPNSDNDLAYASKKILYPTNHTLLMIGRESQRAFETPSFSNTFKSLTNEKL